MSTSNQFINIYEKLFNIIFDNGFVPHIWLIGTIKPIYKNKGDIYEPKNYRPITIVSCLGKLFTSILNTPFAHSKYSDIQLLYEIQDVILSYILIITLYILPLILFNIIL
jgi:hypothetical protein